MPSASQQSERRDPKGRGGSRRREHVAGEGERLIYAADLPGDENEARGGAPQHLGVGGDHE